MRISKEPEVRKQEIIDTAMKVFAQKGYEAATMKDIAREMNVASGLCYHYFENKQVLYETAVSQYAKACAGVFIEIFRQTDLPLEACLEKLGAAWLGGQRRGSYAYEEFFHGEGNELFHRQLDMHMIHEVVPYVEVYLEELKKRQEIEVEDARSAALFILNGQAGIINDMSIPEERRYELLKTLIVKVLK
ncbi:TetR family transcriptional regulator [Clostridium sp. MCC353]|uniref:TetR/AcrR family transcriptional regulator n=1 Tax=Clostridium sp. MCC353 TaxID=2592646 RepID=UPI001C0238BF|nr:TetR/AcrR family transcriptional regulator [Clostridium sp. MCC353]MBT9775057.1 TetR family transcriptional regulator [Clostridium sp. MCC353]